MTNVNQKSLILEIEKVGGVSKTNAQNILGIMTRACKTDVAGLITALTPSPVRNVTVKKAVKKTVKKAVKKTTKKAVKKTASRKSTAKKNIPAVAKTTPKRKALKKPQASNTTETTNA